MNPTAGEVACADKVSQRSPAAGHGRRWADHTSCLLGQPGEDSIKLVSR